MKILVGEYQNTSYIFDASSKQITLLNFNVTLSKEQILMITNFTTGTIIFNGQMGLLGSISSNVLTLDYDTTTMNDTDSLQILVEIEDPNTDILHYLKQMIKLLEASGTVDSNNRQRVAVEAMPTTTITIGTSGGANVTGIGYPSTSNTVGGNPYTLTASQPTQLVATLVDQRWELMEFAHISYQNIRSKITFS